MLIVADDLTGAADAAAAFVARGHRAVVELHPRRGAPSDVSADAATDADAEVVSIDTNGRASSAADAARASAAAVVGRRSRGLFVKVDSTWRGHIEATVDAVLAALPRLPRRLVVCPAFPALGRTVVDGCVHVDGSALPQGHVRSSLPDLGPDVELWAPDATTEVDLATIVASALADAATIRPHGLRSGAVEGDGHDVVWVGSAGLARHVAASLVPPGHVRDVPVAATALPRARRVVVVAGTRHQATTAQLATLDSGCEVVRIDPRDERALGAVRHLVDAADGLVLTGGQTARAILDLLAIESFRVGGEVEVGIPWGTAEQNERDHRDRAGRLLVTKAGGFGEPDSLRRAVAFLSGPE